MYRVVNGAIIRDSFETAAGAMARVADIMDRHDQREAQYAVGMATEFVRNGWEGFDTVGSDGKPVRTRGIRELGWSELERDETSVSEKTRELLKSVREQDFYRNMSGGQRKLFERSWAFKESELNRAASVRTGELVRQRAVDHDKELLALHTKQVADRNGKADGSYEKTRDWATMQNFGIMMGTGLRHREILDDPNATFDDVAKAEGWDDETKELTRMKFDKLRATFDVGRVQALVEAGASNRSLGDVSAEETLVLAKRVAHALNGRDYDGNAVDGAHKYVDDAQYNEILSAIGKADASRQRTAALAQDAAWENAKAQAVEVEVKMNQIPVPNETTAKAAFFGEMSKKYDELAANPSLPPETRLKYAKTARALEKDSFDMLNEEIFTFIKADFLSGGYVDENGKWNNYDAASMKDSANELLVSGKITKMQWSELMKIRHVKSSEEMDGFRSRVLDRMKSVVPSCVATGQNGFRFVTTKGKTLSSTAFTNKRGWLSSGEAVTYLQLVEAMNLTMDWWQQRGKGASIDDALAHFDELTKGIVKDKQQRDIDAALEEERRANESWRNGYGL